MENNDIHSRIDDAVGEQKWHEAVSLCQEALREDPDDFLVSAKLGLAFYRLGDHHQAAATLVAVCMILHEDMGDDPVLIQVFISCRSALILCQLKSVGYDKRMAALQATELDKLVGDWTAREILHNEDALPMFAELLSRAGLA